MFRHKRAIDRHFSHTLVNNHPPYGNYFDEVWTLDDRRVGITVGDLNDGTGNDRHFYHQNTLYHVLGRGGLLGFLYRDAG